MRHNILIKLSLVCVFLVCCVSPAWAAFTPLNYLNGSTLVESGWGYELTGATTGLVVTGMDLGTKIATITITKDYGPPVYDPLVGIFELPVGMLNFNETAANSGQINKFIIHSETIDNHTGVDWDSFVWKVRPTGAAAFNVAESSGWTVSPFSIDSFDTGQLLANSGLVANGASFSPYGGLVIDIDLGSSDSALFFQVKQIVTPEPATMALLLVGGAGILNRRFRRR